VRGRRPVLASAGLLLGLLLAGVWLVPGMLDWNRYRDGIAALATQQLGRPVHIRGAVSLQLFPQPILTAADVSVNDAAGGQPTGAPRDAQTVVLSARALRLRVALGPLLAGKVDARELVLQGADLRMPWPPPAGALAQRPPDWLTGLQAHVEKSRLQVGDLVLDDIDATITTDPDTGTLSTAGVGQAGTRRWQFTGRLTRPGRDGSAALDLSLDGQGKLRDTGGTFSGQIDADGAMSGRVAGRGPDLSALMPAPALPWRGDGRLKASAGLAVADELALEIGGAPSRGSMALRVLPALRLDLAVAAGRLDLDAWLPALLGRNTGSLRSGIPTSIDLSTEAATLAGGTLRRLRATVDLGQGPIRLRDIEVVLPGEAKLSLAGQVAADPRPSFDGTMHVAAPDLRATLRWLQGMLPGWVATLPPAVLRSADLTALVTADAAQASIVGLRGAVDGAQWTGTASIRLGARPGITAALAVDHLAPRAFFKDPAALLSADAWQAGLAALRLADMDLKLQVQRADWGGVPIGPVAVELQSEAARVTLRRLEAQPLGARLSVSGQVSDAGRLSDGRLELNAPDLASLRPLTDDLPGAASLAPVLPLLRGPGALTVQASGAVDALTGRATLELGDLRIEAQPTVNLVAQRWAGPLTLHHPGAPRLLDALGVGGTAAWLGDGSLSLVAQMTATPGRLALDSATLAAGALRASGKLTLEGRMLSGQIAAETLPLPLLFPRSPDPLPLAGLRLWQAALRLEAAQVLVGLTPVLQGASADLTLDAATLRLDRIMGRSQGGAVSGALTIDAAADPPRLAVQGQMEGVGLTESVFETPVDVVAGKADLSLDVTASGHSPAALLATLAGKGALRMQDGLATGFDLAAAATALALPDPREATQGARSALQEGSTPFSSVEAPLAVDRGLVTTDAVLTSPAGKARLSGGVDLLGGGLDLRLTLLPDVAGVGGAGPILGMRLTGKATAPVRTPEMAGVARWLADRPPP
jgi:uncharacterized protein involved in outer membrane biogenesis